MEVATRPLGEYLRDWRRRRRMSQLDLACDAEISARHLSFVETGRARPSREMVLHLCDRLGVPLRERNLLLMSAGHAPVFPARPLDDPSLDQSSTLVPSRITKKSFPSAATGSAFIVSFPVNCFTRTVPPGVPSVFQSCCGPLRK